MHLTTCLNLQSRRPFRPSSGTSSSGVKDLSHDFNEAEDPTENDILFDDGGCGIDLFKTPVSSCSIAKKIEVEDTST
ncbi:hypothetical protein ACET3Z_023546 [Daucus carota]